MSKITVYHPGCTQPIWTHEDTPESGYAEVCHLHTRPVFISIYKDKDDIGHKNVGVRELSTTPLRKVEFYGIVED